MNLFVIVLSLVLFYGSYIYALESEELSGVDVLAELEAKVPVCNLTRFVQTPNDYNELKADLQKYCAVSISLKQHRILCNMLSYQLQKACGLSEQRGPSPAKYTTKVSAQQVCLMRNMMATNLWIWKRITNNGNKQIGVTAEELCNRVASQPETLRLARFFYKTAPRVRVADTQNTKDSSDSLQSNTTSKTSTESILDAAKNGKDNLVDATQTNKEKSQQSVETDFKKTNESTQQLNDNTTRTGDRPKEKSAEAGEIKKENADQTVDSMKKTTGQVVENTKDNIGTTTVTAKDNATLAVAAEKDKVVPSIENAKDKTTPVVDTGKDKVVPNTEDAKDKAGQVAEIAKDKVGSTVDGAKDKVNSNLNVSSNLENTTAQADLDKGKQVGESAVVTTTNAVKLSDGTVNEASKTNQSTEQILDLKTDSKTDSQTQKDQIDADDNDDDDNDDGNKKESKDNQQSGQIPKPDLPTKKDEEKDDSKKSESPNIMKQYKISSAQLIDLIKNNQLNTAGKKIDPSLINSTSADQLVARKKTNALDSSTRSFSTLITLPSSSTKIYYHEINRNDQDRKKNKQADGGDDDDGVKKDDRNDGQDENDTDTAADEEAQKQLKSQQEESDKNDYQTAIDNKDRTGINKSPIGLEIKKPNAEERNRYDKGPELSIKDTKFDSSRTRIKSPSEKYADDDGWSGNFVTYFLLFTLFIVVGYLVLHNKNKVLGLLIEGCRRDRSAYGRRHGGSSSSARYQRLSQSS